jgi:hypothetical protein
MHFPLDFYSKNGKAQSEDMIYPRLKNLSESSPPSHEPSFNRSLPPDAEYARGISNHISKIAANQMMESPSIYDQQPNMVVWRGWRPKRPEISAGTLPIQMPLDEATRKVETFIPSEAEIRAAAENIDPFPTFSAGKETYDIDWRTYTMSGSYLGMGDLGEEEKAKPPEPTFMSTVLSMLPGLATSIAGGIKSKYDAKAALYAQRAQIGIPYAGSVPQPPSPPAEGPSMPWGIIAAVVAVGAGAFFFLKR